LSLEKCSNSQGEIVTEDRDVFREEKTLSVEGKISSVEEKFELWS